MMTGEQMKLVQDNTIQPRHPAHRLRSTISMTISRRQFLRTGSLCALFAGFSLSSYGKVFGQEDNSDQYTGHFQVPQEATADPVYYFTRETFTPYVGGVFTIYNDIGRPFRATLVEVSDCRTAAQKSAGEAGECFALHFRHLSDEALPQATRDIEHAALGKFALLLVPAVTEEGVFYTATINHLGPTPPRPR
jgi:hypothetical protein